MSRTVPEPIRWPLLPTPDASGRLNWPSLEDSIQQSIRIILATRPGEQLMRPGFGAGLAEFIGQPDSTLTRRRVQDLVRDSLNRWEPRIELEAVDVDGDPQQPGWLRVEIRFRIRRTGASRRMGLNLALENG